MTLFSSPRTALSQLLLPAAALLLTVPAAPAHASGNRVQATVTDATGGSTTARLTCSPPQGHPHAAEACKQLAAVQGQISAIPADTSVSCGAVYDPVTASASGVWDGHRITYKKTFSNACLMRASTRAVFALDA
jgi:hypothetical protein